MKRLIFLFVFGIMSLVSFGQVDTLYLSKHHGSTSYHSTLDCPKVYEVVGEIVVADITSMSQVNKYFRCYECVTKDIVSDIRMTALENKNSNADIENYNRIYGNGVYLGGLYQEKSAKCHFIALGFAGAAGLSAAIPSMMGEDTREQCGTTGFYVAAGVLGLGAFVSEICALSFQLKSGKSLKVGATKIQYNF